MRVFLTGGSGFVGGAIIDRLRQDGHDVVALARSDASAERVRVLGAEPVRGDLEQLANGTPDWLSELAACDAVIHAAAYMEFWGPDRLFEQRNLRPTVALHAAAVSAGVRRFVLLSAASISSGSQRAPVVDENSDDGRPNIAYSRVKLATEQALLAAPAGNTELVFLRPPYVWGDGMTTLRRLVDAVDAGQFAWIDSGKRTMDFVHVDNLAHATALALDHGKPGGVYYITDGAPQTIREFFGALLETQGATPPTRSVPRPIATALAAIMDSAFRLLRRPTAPPLTLWLVCIMGRDRSYDITAARRELRYAPVVSFERGVAAMRERRTHEPALAR